MTRLSLRFPLAARAALLVLANALVALLLSLTHPPLPLSALLGTYFVCASTGLVACLVTGIRLTGVLGLIVIPTTSFAALFVATIVPYFCGVRYSPAHAALELIVLQALLLLGLLVPSLRRSGERALGVQKARAATGPRRYAAAAGAVVAAAAIATTLVLVGHTQPEQVGSPYSVLALDDATAKTATVDAAAGQKITLPVHLTTTGGKAPAQASVTLDGKPAGTVALQSNGQQWQGVAEATAPTAPGRYRMEVRVANPTYVAAPAPSNPALDQGADGEAQGSAKDLTVAVWVVVA